ncbi:hypothetical protein B9T33_10935 [Acinetobacter sp. ANC 5054]|nr:hypothetical protein B9T33_10935 [Acinetobacter sp. ANC 5054]
MMQPQTFKPFLIRIQFVISASCIFAATNIFTSISKNYRFHRQAITTAACRLMQRALGKNGKVKYESSI